MINRRPAIFGIRCRSAGETEDGAIIVEALESITIYLIGKNLSVALTTGQVVHQDDCTHCDRIKFLKLVNISLNVAQVVIESPSPGQRMPLYFRLREAGHTAVWFHKGSHPWLKIYVESDFLRFYMMVVVIGSLLMISRLNWI